MAKKFRKGKRVKFFAFNDLGGFNYDETGVIIGHEKEIKERYPIEMGELKKDEGMYLIKAENEKLFVVHEDEINSEGNPSGKGGELMEAK